MHVIASPPQMNGSMGPPMQGSAPPQIPESAPYSVPSSMPNSFPPQSQTPEALSAMQPPQKRYDPSLFNNFGPVRPGMPSYMPPGAVTNGPMPPMTNSALGPMQPAQLSHRQPNHLSGPPMMRPPAQNFGAPQPMSRPPFANSGNDYQNQMPQSATVSSIPGSVFPRPGGQSAASPSIPGPVPINSYPDQTLPPRMQLQGPPQNQFDPNAMPNVGPVRSSAPGSMFPPRGPMPPMPMTNSLAGPPQPTAMMGGPPPMMNQPGSLAPPMGSSMPPHMIGSMTAPAGHGSAPPHHPMSGPASMPYAGPGAGAMPGMQPQQKRLDPNMMPSAVQVIDDARRAHSGLFQTGYPRAELPPLVTTEIFCEDQGNCSPKFVRSTLYNGPISSDLLKQSAVPFALTISPVALLNDNERPLSIINMGDLGPVRCHRCKAYMCPYMEFNFGGRRFLCPFCKANTDVPTEYFAHLDQNGQRTDLCERPELCFGSYEFVATKEYCKNGVCPKSPAFIFMLDVSYNACRTGLIKSFCENIKSLLQHLPKEANETKSSIKVGFATYDQSVHFYSLKSALGQPKMLIINDVQDTFVPIVDGFLVDLQEAETVIDNLLSQIPQMFADSKITEVILGPVVQAGMDALKAADRAGKLFIFHTSLPTFEAPGKLKNRDDKQVIGTDKEKTILLPQSEFYTKLGQECVTVGCCVDIFLFPNSYIDVSTIGAMCGMTGGQMYKYQYFQPDIDGQRFLNDLKHDIERPVVFDAIMRVRTSTGIRPTDFFGNFFMQNTTDVELAAIDSDKTVTVEIKHDDKIEDQSVFIQVALLFTSVGGQRRLKIHNLSLNVATELADLYRSADLFSIISYLTKQGERLLLQKSPREVRENLVNRASQMLATYRQHCSPSSSFGQLVLPETMKLLPLMINCIMKHSAFTGGADLSFDDRAWLMQNIPAMTSLDLVYYLYPRIIPVMEICGEDTAEEMPVPVRCTYEYLLPTGAYLFENSVVIMLWIGNQISQQWIMDVFGVQSFAQINADKHELPEKDNQTSRFVRRIFNKLQANRTRYMKLYIIKQQDKLEPWFKKFMVEDRGADSSPSYVEFLCHIHKEIRNLLS